MRQFNVSDVARVHRQFPAPTIMEVKPQRCSDGPKGELMPRNFVFAKEFHFKALFAGSNVQVVELRHIEEMHLVDMRNIEDREQRPECYACAGFFQCFTHRALRR